MTKDRVFAEFKAYRRIADDLLEKATKEQLSTGARILALQSAHYSRTYGELPPPNLFELPQDHGDQREGARAPPGRG